MKNRLVNDPALRRRVASYSPGDLLKRSFFWRAQKSFWVVVLAGLLSFIVLAPYTYGANVWVVLTLGVQALAFWGALITAKAMARIEVETAIVNEIEARGTAHLGTIKARTEDRISLDQLEERMLPHNSSLPPPAMIRLFQHICKEARDRKFESSVNVIQPYREEVLEDIFRLQNIQKIALWLGILGTFIGLLGAIRVGEFGGGMRDKGSPTEVIVRHAAQAGGRGGGEQDSQAFEGLISSMFDNLFVSFSASLAGLEVAVILGAFLLVLRSRQEIYFKSMETAVVTMLSLARNAINKDDFFVEFGQIRASLEQVNERLYQQTQEVSGGLEHVQGRIGAQTEHIQAGMDKLARTGAEFDRFLKQVSARQQELIEDVRSVYDAVSLRNLGTTLQESIVQAGRHISETLNPNVAQITERIASFNEALDKLGGTMQQQALQTAQGLERLEAQLTAHTAQHASALQTMSKQLQEQSNRAKALNPEALNNMWANLSQNISALNKTLERANKYMEVRVEVPARRWSVRGVLSNIGRKLSSLGW